MLLRLRDNHVSESSSSPTANCSIGEDNDMDKSSMLLNIALSRLDSQIKYAVDSIEQMKKDMSDINLDIITIKETLNTLKGENKQ